MVSSNSHNEMCYSIRAPAPVLGKQIHRSSTFLAIPLRWIPFILFPTYLLHAVTIDSLSRSTLIICRQHGPFRARPVQNSNLIHDLAYVHWILVSLTWMILFPPWSIMHMLDCGRHRRPRYYEASAAFAS